MSEQKTEKVDTRMDTMGESIDSRTAPLAVAGSDRSAYYDLAACPICRWPAHPEMMNMDLICECCGYSPEADGSLLTPYTFDGKWWFVDGRPPEIVERLQARVAALTGGGNQQPRGVRGDPGVDRGEGDDARDKGSALSSSLPPQREPNP